MTNYQRTAARYKRTAAHLAGMVSRLAEELEDQYRESAYREEGGPKPYPAERTKYDDQPLQVAPMPDEPIPTKPTYSIPFPPPLEHRVIDTNGRRWLHSNDHGIFDRLGVELAWDGPDAPDGLPVRLEWVALLASYGPVTLDEWTDEDKAGFVLYGPPGARWGNPNVECPFYACALGVGHVGLHHDSSGNPIEPPPADGSTVDASITPHEASQTPCTCGHPDRHWPECPRYAKVSGVGYDEPPPSQAWMSRNDEQRDLSEEAANAKLMEEE